MTPHPSQLPFFAAGGDLPLFSRAKVCTCNDPPHEETRQCQYEQALQALYDRRSAGALTRSGFFDELASLADDYPDCAPTTPPKGDRP